MGTHLLSTDRHLPYGITVLPADRHTASIGCTSNLPTHVPS